MAVYLKQFSTHQEYEQYINGSDAILPNVSICTTEGDVHYNPWVDTRVAATFNVTDTSSPTQLCYYSAVDQFSAIEIDGVEQSVVSAYTFDTIGEHTVKYTLKNPRSIDSSAFRDCSGLISIDIPNSITSIDSSAFRDCSSLTSITIPDSVTSIGSSAFTNCSGLTSIDIPNSVTSIDSGAFRGSRSLTSCTIGSGVTSIGNYTFQGCSSLTSIVSNAITAPTIQSNTFAAVHNNGTLTVPQGSSGYDVWMGTSSFYLGYYSWTKVEQ